MILSHKIQLDPTQAQREYFTQAAGCARFTYNWALAEWERQYNAGLKPKANDLKKQFNAIKHELFPWIKEIHKDAHAYPFSSLWKAYQKFFQKKAKRPRFKKKGKSRAAFYLSNDKFETQAFRVRMPRIGWVRMTEELRFVGKIVSATVSEVAGRWFVSVNVETSNEKLKNQKDKYHTVGVDLGIKTLAVVSDGQTFANPNSLRQALKKLRRLNKAVSRKIKGSANRKKAQQKLAKLHYKIACIRNDNLHKITTHLTKTKSVIVIEDLHVKGMLKNRKLSRAVSDLGLGEFRRQLEYKGRLYDCDIQVADRFFPSSKTCGACGEINQNLTLKDREWTCPGCGETHDRDFNASCNLEYLAVGLTESRNACGEESSDSHRVSETVLCEAGTKPCSFTNAN